MSIIVNNITRLYGTQKAVDNVSFEIDTGEIVGFLGPNGAGKSTMMKIITGYLPPTHGKVLLNGMDISEKPIEIKKLIGYLPENNPLYLDMYVREYLKLIAGIYKLGVKAKQRIKDIIELTGLEIEQHKKIGQLSKGYRQRVGLAQALIHDPEILILDEPTSGLDPNQLVEIRNLISLAGKEKTVLLSTHIMQEVEALANRVIIIDKGKIKADESKANIYSHTKDSLITIMVEFDVELEEKTLETIQGVEKIKLIDTKNFLIQASEDLRPTIFKFAVDNKITVLSMQLKPKSLEEVFQELTK